MFNIINSINAIEENLYKLQNSSDEEAEECGVNGKIDEPVYQGNYEDCWIISGVLAMSYTNAGADIIHDSINIKDDGSINVAYSGIGKDYSITREEFNKYNYPVLDEKSDFTTGDDDMLAIEMTTKDSIEDLGITKYDLEHGGNPYYIFKMFNADNIIVTKSKDDIETAFNEFENNPGKYAMTMGITNPVSCSLKTGHGYTIKNIDGDNVILVDPWDTSEEITVSRKDLTDNSNGISIVYAEFST